jgi:hypothetical protein
MATAFNAIAEINKSSIASDNNGAFFNPTRAGAGTDYTYGVGAVAIPLASLVITGSTCTQSGRAFVPADVGNYIKLSNSTVRYEVISVAGGTATLDSAPGNQTVSAVLGGPGLTPNLIVGVGVNGNRYYIRKESTPYIISTRVTGIPNDNNIPLFCVPSTGSGTWIEGYATVRGDAVANYGTQNLPIIQVDSALASNPSALFITGTVNGFPYLRGLIIDTIASSIVNVPAQNCRIDHCVLKNFNTAFFRNTYYKCYLDNSGMGSRVGCPQYGGSATECVFRRCQFGIWQSYDGACSRNVFIDCGVGVQDNSNATACEFYNCGSGVTTGDTTSMVIEDCLFHSCTACISDGGIRGAGALTRVRNCFRFNSPALGSWAGDAEMTLLASDPYANAAGLNFTRVGTPQGIILGRFPGTTIPAFQGSPGVLPWAGSPGAPMIGSRIGKAA